jgi:hypothetical protein
MPVLRKGEAFPQVRAAEPPSNIEPAAEGNVPLKGNGVGWPAFGKAKPFRKSGRQSRTWHTRLWPRNVETQGPLLI